MDTDWCLACDRHFDGNGPYCSLACERPASSLPPHFLPSSPSDSADEDETIYHILQWSSSADAAILAWAAEIPAGPPLDTPHFADNVSQSPSPSTSVYRSPKLLLPHQRPMPPTLCMSMPQPAPASPSRPIVTPQQQMSALSINPSGSTSKASLPSCATESMVATPSSARPVPIFPADPSDHRQSVLGAIATHVRSWVSPSPQLAASHLKHRIDSTPSPKHSNSKFTVLARSHLHNFSSSHSSLDALSQDDIPPLWCVSTTLVVDPPIKGEFTPLAKLPRGLIPALEPPSSIRDLHSYRSRGRKLSRVAA